MTNDPCFEIEVICGARRLFIARRLRTPLRVELRDLTDRQAAKAVEAENTLRKQTSPYERGLWFALLLRNGIYRSQDEMARELGITPTQVTRLLKFTDVPRIVLNAFASPHDILESWIVELHKGCSDNRYRTIVDRARALGDRVPRPPAVSVYEALLASRGNAAKRIRRGASRIVTAPDGEPLLRFQRLRTEVVFKIPNYLVDTTIENAVAQAVVAVLTRGPRAAEDGEPTPMLEPRSAAPETL